MTEREIFFAALEMATPEARAAYLHGACRGEVTLRRRVEELLKEHFSNDSLLAEPSPVGELPTLKHDLPPAEAPAQMLGRYKLLEKIGEGGFGEVWMAEQREPIKRRVALKIIKLGMDSRQIINRFAAERQALAMMDHPNIAKIFDAGTTGATDSPLSTSNSQLSQGRPYFVMELVRGIKITEYCDQNQLPTRERLRLFILVCQAIQHAHQKGIIHRDIKPSNILVTLHDGVPVPKVIDFGIAKATQQELTDQTVFSQFQQFIGTPAYISPEQAEMSGLDIDTRADIYSLGVLLYELLTGKTPFDAKELLAAGLDGMRRTIREVEPLTPAKQVDRILKLRVESSGQRDGYPRPPLNSQLKPLSTDLDWIVMKCLEKDRTRRYDTANGLAAVLQRHLTNEPVMARPPSLGYVLLKFVGRHRTGVSVGSALALTVLLGAGVSVWQAVRAGRHADMAETRRREAESSRQVAARAQERAERSVKEVSHQLARHYVDNGVQRLDAGDYAGSWVWFAEALRVDQANPAFESIHRLRLGALSRACPTLLQLFAHKDFVITAEFSPDGRRLVTVSLDKTARIWDAQTGAPLTPPLLHGDRVWRASFSPDGRRLATACFDRTARIWDVTDRRILPSELKESRLGGVYLGDYPVSFSPDGQRMVGTDIRGSARVWNTLSGTPLTPSLHANVKKVIFSPDGRLVATAGNRSARLWDAQTGAAMGSPMRHDHRIYYLASVPTANGSSLPAGSQDKTARVWDAATGQPITPPLQHHGRVDYAMFTADDRALRTISHDPETHIGHAWTWDLSPDTRSTKDLLFWAELYSGHRFDASGALAPLDAAALAETWRTLRLP